MLPPPPPTIISKKTYVIGSGKGGVGKSTVAVNLAIALAKTGAKVGLLDADIYGPSIPIMLGLRRLPPRTLRDSNGKERVIPFSKFGIQTISIGFFIEEARSTIWRGPMLHGVLQKLISEVEWGPLDYLIIDLPPGTGDVPLSLNQLIKIDQAIVVTTPQEVAMVDAIKAIHSFDQLEIPLLGIVENMAGFQASDSEDIHYIFGKGKGSELANRFEVPLLATIPLMTAIRQGGDEGYPIAFHDGADSAGQPFHALVEHLLMLENKDSNIPNPFI